MHVLHEVKLRRQLAGKGKHRLGKPPRWLYPHNAERTYNIKLNKIVSIIRNAVNTVLIPKLPTLLASVKVLRPDGLTIHLDATLEQITSLFSAMEIRINKQMPDSDKLSKDIAALVNAYNKGQFDKVAKSVLGVDVFIQEPWLQDEVALFAHNNVQLIKSIPQQALGRVQQVVMSGLRSGSTTTSLASKITDQFGITKRRAKTIARDQVGKLNGQLTKLRQKSLGVNSYVWRTSMDERVRGDPDGKYPNAEPSHFAREGKKYSWDKPPSDGNPGEPVNCRCYAEPVFGGLLDEI